MNPLAVTLYMYDLSKAAANGLSRNLSNLNSTGDRFWFFFADVLNIFLDVCRSCVLTDFYDYTQR